jgi:hypothetical protein
MAEAPAYPGLPRWLKVFGVVVVVVILLLVVVGHVVFGGRTLHGGHAPAPEDHPMPAPGDR